MKILQIIMALFTLIALLMPCVHAEDAHHHDAAPAELCSIDHAECHTCSDKPCVEAPDAAVQTTIAEIPEPQLPVLCELLPEHDSFVEFSLPVGGPFHLLTVQLLI